MTPHAGTASFQRPAVGADNVPQEGDTTKKPTHKQLDSLGVFLLITGVVIGMGVAWIGNLPLGLSISMIVLALVLVAGGLALNRKFRAKDER